MAEREWSWTVWGSAPPVQRFRLLWSYRPLPIVIVGLTLFIVTSWWFWSDFTTLLCWLLNRSEDIRNLMLSAGVIGAGIGIWIAFRRWKTDRDRQITDSFGRAVELLAHGDRSVRLGAIYALERIARQNKDEHWPIMETLTAYVREWSARRIQRARGDAREPAPADIQTIFSVLGRRRTEHEDATRVLNLNGAYLAAVDPDPGRSNRQFSNAELNRVTLTGAKLVKAVLVDAVMQEANLRDSQLQYADLRRALLQSADLRDADLFSANLRGAYLSGAKLMNSNLYGSDLRNALVDNANFSGADLGSADLSTARELNQLQLNSADGDAHTKVPRGLTPPPHWET